MSIIIAETIQDLPDAVKILKREIYRKEANSYNKNTDATNKQGDSQATIRVKCSIKKDADTCSENEIFTSDISDETNDNSIEATPEIAAMVDDLNRLNELKERLQTQEERLKLAIMDYMLLHGKLTFNDRCVVTWKNQARNNFDLKSFKADFADMYKLYTKKSTARVFKLC